MENIRFIKNTFIFLRKEDVVKYMLELASSKNIDIRSKLVEDANNIMNLGLTKYKK